MVCFGVFTADETAAEQNDPAEAAPRFGCSEAVLVYNAIWLFGLCFPSLGPPR
jgi:hypothetical protein